MDIHSSRFIRPPAYHAPPDPAPATSPPPARRPIDARAIGRVYQARTGKLDTPTDKQLGRLLRDFGIALAVDVAGLPAKKVAELVALPPSRVSVIVAQIRAEAVTHA